MLPHIEVSYAFSLLDSLQIMEGEGVFCGGDIIVFLTLIFLIGEGNEAIVHSRAYEGCVVRKVFRFHHRALEFNLYSAVFHCPHIYESSREKIWRNGDIIISKKVFLCAVEVIEGAAETISEHGEIHTYIPVYAFFPP